MTLAAIIHADLDAFYASVEQLLDPSLRGLPIAVGGGVVLAASYEAKAFGVRSGMAGRRARELCPDLIFVGGHFGEYQRLGDAAMRIVGDFTPLVERISPTLPAPNACLARLSRSPKQSAAAFATRWGCRFRSAWRAPNTWPRSPRRWRSPMGWWRSIHSTSSRSSMVFPSS
jgi:DNA polymerase-4